MRKFLSTGLLCALAVCAAVRPAMSAQEEQRPARTDDPCAHAETQFEMNECARRKFKKADAEMNVAYQRLMRDAVAREKPRLKAAQLAWLKFRDAECDYESVLNIGGSMYSMVVNFCLADVTNARTKQLRESLRKFQEEK